jgi:hypothetical protein
MFQKTVFARKPFEQNKLRSPIFSAYLGPLNPSPRPTGIPGQPAIT